MKFSNRVLGLLAFAGGAILCLAGWRMAPTPGSTIGPGFFPLLIGLTLLASGALLVVGAASGPKQPAVELPAWLADRWSLINVATVAAAIVFYVVAVERLGFIPTAAVIVGVLGIRLGQSPLRAVPTGLATAAVFHLMFVKLLRVPLPAGLLQGWI
jgi:putative tricarboxylic transport membrane protein